MVCGSSRKGPAVLLHCTSTFKVYRQASQDCARDIIKQRTPQAVYVHCRKVHSLNLAFGSHASTSSLEIRWFRCNWSASPLTIRQNAFWRSKNALLIDVDNDVVREGMQRRTKLCTLSCAKLFWRAGQILCSPFVQHSALSCRLQKAFLQVGTAIQGIVCAKTGCSLVYAQ